MQNCFKDCMLKYASLTFFNYNLKKTNKFRVMLNIVIKTMTSLCSDLKIFNYKEGTRYVQKKIKYVLAF